MIYEPRPIQQFAEEHIYKFPGAGLFLDMGFGKTVITLTALDRLMFQEMEIEKPIIIAPKKVAEDVWTSEAEKWDHLNHLKISLVLGSERQRIEALRSKADIWVINRENVDWLIGFYGSAFPFDTIVIDELSSFKSPQARRFKALRKVRPMVKRMIGLTGTPAPNGLLDLWSQLYLLDQGERLGETLTSYRNKYFQPGKRNGMIVYDYNLRKDGNYQQEIYDKISDICISAKSEDYLDLPKRIDHVSYIHLPPKIMQKYEEFERNQILALEDADEINAINAAALTNKLLQFANGAVYNEDKSYQEVHVEKLEALEEQIEAANGEPVLIFYSYKHDLERIMKHLKKYKPEILKTASEIKRWNEKQIPVLCAHPASAGHGLNLQFGGHIMQWFGLPWSLEYYQQGGKRLDRPGQLHPVLNNRLIVKGTMDEDVLAALDNKAAGQDALMLAVKARVEKYKKRKAA